jgi:acyl-coenzyme A thioesterase PaaI-like protein
MQILETWQKLSRFPGGSFVFNKILARWVPYTGSIFPEVLELEPGHARIRMKDRPSVRNHLRSIHAAALMNFAEAASGMAFVSGLPPNTEAIVTSFKIDYLKKARGTLTAECQATCPQSNAEAEYDVQVDVKNAEGDIVARGQARWRVAPAAVKRA